MSYSTFFRECRSLVKFLINDLIEWEPNISVNFSLINLTLTYPQQKSISIVLYIAELTFVMEFWVIYIR